MKKIRLTGGMRFVADSPAEQELFGDPAANPVEIIASLPVFSMLDKERIKDILQFSKLRRYGGGETIIRENRKAERLFFLIKGRVGIEKNNVRLGELCRTGDLFGEMSFIDKSARSASVLARKETLCLEVDMSGVDLADIEGNGAFLAVFYRVFSEVLAHRLRKMNEELIYLRNRLQQTHAAGKHG